MKTDKIEHEYRSDGGMGQWCEEQNTKQEVQDLFPLPRSTRSSHTKMVCVNLAVV